MKKIEKILAPTDLSDLSQAGVRHALEMAKSGEVEVIVYHVIPPEEGSPHDEGFYTDSLGQWLIWDRKKHLAEFITEHFADLLDKVTVYIEVEIGIPHRRIVEKSKERGVDMIVMSTHGRSGLLHMLMGSVTEKVIRSAPCPVLSLRPAKEARLHRAAAA